MRHAICNEIFEGWTFPAAAKAIRAAGYEGIEIATFTLAESPAKISVEQRRQVRSIIDSEGLKFVGLHWLMVSPQGLHVTTPDRDLRERSWRHIRELIDLAADLGPGRAGDSGVAGPILVFGSPKQRSTVHGPTCAGATSRFCEGLTHCPAPPLPRRRTD